MEEPIANKRRPSLFPTSAPAAAAAALHRPASRAISKPKPKIRIIHIFAPEIIKTDVANFRDLVQRLTGKPPAKEKKVAAQSEPVVGGGACRRVKEEEAEEEELNDVVVGMWNDAVEMDGFIDEFGEFPLLSNSSSAHQLMHAFGETQFV